MNIDRIKEIQRMTPYPYSVSVQQALLKVWNETEQEFRKKENQDCNEKTRIHRNVIKSISEKVYDDAKKMKMSAGYAGEFGDGGASALLEKLDIFLTALSPNHDISIDQIPEFLKPYLKQEIQVQDPEYAEFQRLKEKFEK